jgi:hypothetical protein
MVIAASASLHQFIRRPAATTLASHFQVSSDQHVVELTDSDLGAILAITLRTSAIERPTDDIESNAAIGAGLDEIK